MKKNSMWREYGMAKEWSEFWRRSNAPNYEGTAGGEHRTMMRTANEPHAELKPIEWKKFHATDIYQKEVFGMYGGERIAVDRLDYDAYGAPEHYEVITSKDGEVRGYVMSGSRVTGPHALTGPEDLTADQKDRMTQESGLYDYVYGSYNEKKQLNVDMDIKENESIDTYNDHIDGLYKEKAMNENQNTEQHTHRDDHMEPGSSDTGSENVIRPAHYASSNPDVPPIQMWDYALSQNLGFFEGNIVKYVSRWRSKGGVQDLQKALTYLQRLMDSQGSPKP